MAEKNKTETILLVDDTPANLRLLSQILSERGYYPLAVTSGQRALASVAVQPPDLILLDIRMPVMDGFEVCQVLKSNPKSRDIPVIFISALDEIHDKVRAFAVGGVDYITKPFQLEEVIARVETHLRLRLLQRNLQDTNQRMQRELTLAAQVQASLMRRNLPEVPGWQFSTALLPARLTCGDFFDAFRLPGGELAILIADVMDKGVGAALYMAMSCTLLRTFAMEHPAQPAHALQLVNQRILQDTAADQFVTVFLGVVDTETGQIVYSNAGHPPPILVNPIQPGESRLLENTGPPLGLFPEIAWGQNSLQLASQDILVLYTDGIPEAEGESQSLYTLERLVELVAARTAVLSANSDPIAWLKDEILGDVQQFTDYAPLLDDIALMLLARA